MLAIYMATTLAYSFYLKRQPIVDAFTLAALFTMRLGIGITRRERHAVTLASRLLHVPVHVIVVRQAPDGDPAGASPRGAIASTDAATSAPTRP